MSAPPTPELLSVADFERIPDPPGGHYELHHGTAVFVTFPLRAHKWLQRRLRRLLEHRAELKGYLVDTEYPYRPLPENEVWGADVACLLESRDLIQKWLEGSPEIVIEVKSPSNRREEIHDKAMTTLAGNGSVEFWVVDADKRSVTVYSRESGMKVYGAGLVVPVPLLDMHIPVDSIFEGIDIIDE